ncbi:ABC transporter ATP-binding protein [Clostridiaceae bacterium M8S5]|nr:ABC transporter ATP-binding protein [Clostridiaceae bacterium M8S5]
MSSFKKAFKYANEHKNKVYIAMILIFLSVIVGMIPYIITYDIILRFIEDNNVTIGYLAIMSGAIIICLLLKTYLYLRGLASSHEAAYDTLMGMRINFANKMTKLPLGDIAAKGTGTYKKNFIDDIENVEALIAHMIPEGIPYVIIPIIVYIILFILDYRLALLAMGSIPIGMLAMGMMMKTGIKRMVPYYEASQKMNSNIVEYITGMEVIKIFNRTTNSYEKYVSSVKNYKKYTLAWIRDSWTYMAIYGTVLPCTVILLVPFGSMLYIKGTLELAPFVFSILLSMSIGIPLVKLVEFFPIIPNLKYKIEQLETTFEGEELSIDDKKLPIKNHNVNFNNVTFAYDKRDVIKEVSFMAKENTVTAIVGESGSGKSTLAKLLVHFWDVKEGEITIGGVNIKHISFEQLMDLISYVSQDTFLFNTSIIENIRIGKPNATDEEVIEASKKAMCHEFIMNMKDGYFTKAGDSGDKLSGGEKQRITIARAILKNAPIIVLDEATAFTDSENEDKIQEGLNKLIGGKTLIVIAHRLSTIVEADKIILMDNGKLLSEGIHEDMLSKSKKYKDLWDAHIETISWDINVKEVQNA